MIPQNVNDKELRLVTLVTTQSVETKPPDNNYTTVVPLKRIVDAVLTG